MGSSSRVSTFCWLKCQFCLHSLTSNTTFGLVAPLLVSVPINQLPLNNNHLSGPKAHVTLAILLLGETHQPQIAMQDRAEKHSTVWTGLSFNSCKSLVLLFLWWLTFCSVSICEGVILHSSVQQQSDLWKQVNIFTALAKCDIRFIRVWWPIVEIRNRFYLKKYAQLLYLPEGLQILGPFTSLSSVQYALGKVTSFNNKQYSLVGFFFDCCILWHGRNTLFDRFEKLLKGPL